MLYIAVCDDDKNDLNILTSMIDDILSRNNIDYHLQTFFSADEMLKKIKRLDVGILDIAMYGMNGIELGIKLKSRFTNTKLIYTTSFEQFCIQAINEVHAFSYLCKPIGMKNLEPQLMEIISEIKCKKNNLVKSFYKVTDSDGKEYAVVKLKIKDILYFEYIKTTRRIMIVLVGKTYEFTYVMDSLVDELKDFGFAVNCRGCLVNFYHVIKIKGYNVYMDNGKVLPLAQKRVIKFKEMLNDFLHMTEDLYD